MTITDLITAIQSLTREDLDALATAISQRAQALAQEEQETVDARRDGIPAVLAQVRALRGQQGDVYDPTTGQGATIRGVLAHDTDTHQALADNAGLALSLAFQGLDALTGALIDLLVIESAR